MIDESVKRAIMTLMHLRPETDAANAAANIVSDWLFAPIRDEEKAYPVLDQGDDKAREFMAALRRNQAFLDHYGKGV